MIHPLSNCMCENIPESTNIWQFCVIFPNAQIGKNCYICSHCLIENEAVVGNNCTIKCGVQLWDGIILEYNVFIGANVTFTNDLYPRSKNEDWTLMKTIVRKGATIGAGSTILPGLEIGENAMVGAGSVVTNNIPAGEVWAGNPAKQLNNSKIMNKNTIGRGKYLTLSMMPLSIVRLTA